MKNKKLFNIKNKHLALLHGVQIFSYLMGAILSIALPLTALAELKPMQDEELAEISGQALIALDTETAGDSEYIRATLGLEVNTQLNIEDFRVGEYHRWENGDPCFECDGTEPAGREHSARIQALLPSR